MTKAGNSQITRTITLLITIFSLSFPAYAKYSGGTGESNDPYQIATAEDLMLLGETPEDYDKYFIMTADIDLDPNLPGRKVFDRAVIAPVNDSEGFFQGTRFTGVFDGNELTISNMIIEDGEYLGLFGVLENGAEVKNLGVVDVNISGSGGPVGGLAGLNYGSITMSYSTGSVTGTGKRRGVGGLVGSNIGIIMSCYSTGSVSGDGCVGGLVGWNDDSSIIASYSTGSISGETGVGGLVGCNSDSSIISSYSTGPVSGDRNVGGLAGSNYGNITMCYSTGVVTGNDEVGGLVGYTPEGSITLSFWDMEISGQSSSGEGTGATTIEMQTVTTFLEAGWDFVGEADNGTDDVWKIIEGQTYPLLSWQKYGGGTGEPNDPYLIYTAEHLNELGAEPNDWDKHFKLMEDIDLSEFSYGRSVIAPDEDYTEWDHQGTSFTGSLDGNSQSISGLTISGGSYLGLFGHLGPEADIHNLGVEAHVYGLGDYIGILAGYNSGNITTSHSTGSVAGLGSEFGCFGGLVGHNQGIITSCYNASIVSGRECVGGLVGYNNGEIIWSYSTGLVIGNEDVGGLVGANWLKYTGDQNISGSIDSAIIASYSTGAVNGKTNGGGLVGINASNIANCYSSGTVTGDLRIGGFIGAQVTESDTVLNCFWDVETSGQYKSSRGYGKTTAKMQTANTFLEAGWDFVDETANGTENIWWIDEGQDYPRLWWEAAEQ